MDRIGEMAENTIRELYRSLERTIHERLGAFEGAVAGSDARGLFNGLAKTIRDRLAAIEDLGKTANPFTSPPINMNAMDRILMILDRRFMEMNEKVDAAIENLNSQITKLTSDRSPATSEKASLIPAHPLQGIEVIPKKEVVITDTLPEPLSMADRLLLNRNALKALEKEEQEDEWPGEPEEEEKAGEEEEAEEEAEEEEEAEAEDGEPEELIEFEYKDVTYYRDSENNVYMMDEDGELNSTPVGAWSEVKQRVIFKKQT